MNKVPDYGSEDFRICKRESFNRAGLQQQIKQTNQTKNSFAESAVKVSLFEMDVVDNVNHSAKVPTSAVKARRSPRTVNEFLDPGRSVDWLVSKRQRFYQDHNVGDNTAPKPTTRTNTDSPTALRNQHGTTRQTLTIRSFGLMDKASDFESGDCRFESCQDPFAESAVKVSLFEMDVVDNVNHSAKVPTSAVKARRSPRTVNEFLVPDHHEYTQIKIRDDPWTGWFLSDKGFTKIITSVTTRHPNRPHVQTRTARQHYAINTEQHGRHLPSADETLCPGRMT
ncbi:hypothetical protein DPMN_162827 [Dreissena polymorpha]|uniref:Uncharacterized protein n=1 Tax=Dreissena polymorpha TaxID=45954 RepID=A0A9D4ES72_DREPO|nr:hypothetical protein DPMN_162827 [Dreissena polymorpha]